MGSEFIAKAAPSFKKSWDKGRVRRATADLFKRLPECAARTAAGEILGGTKLAVGEKVVVEKAERGFIGRRGLMEVIRIDNPSADLVKALETSCGIAKGTIEQVHELAGVVEVSLC